MSIVKKIKQGLLEAIKKAWFDVPEESCDRCGAVPAPFYQYPKGSHTYEKLCLECCRKDRQRR